MSMFSGILFQQSLQDLVKGIRAHRRDEDDYIRSKITEIADECRSPDIAKKTTAVLKLTHVRLLSDVFITCHSLIQGANMISMRNVALCCPELAHLLPRTCLKPSCK